MVNLIPFFIEIFYNFSSYHFLLSSQIVYKQYTHGTNITNVENYVSIQHCNGMYVKYKLE